MQTGLDGMRRPASTRGREAPQWYEGDVDQPSNHKGASHEAVYYSDDRPSHEAVHDEEHVEGGILDA